MAEKRPTQKQIKKFWEWCGFRFQILQELKPAHRHEANLRWVSPLGEIGGLPDIDFNNLFRYAVPKLGDAWALRIIKKEQRAVYIVELTYCTLKYGDIKKEDRDGALALFWAIWKIAKRSGDRPPLKIREDI